VKLSTGEGARQAPDVLAGRPNGLGEPALIDVDLNGTVDRAYAGDLFGNLYRFDLAATNPRDWTVTKLFQATYDGTLATRQPITKRPYVVKHPTESGFMVVTGTGSYVTENDGTSTTIQSLYGIWDRDEVQPATATPASRNTRLIEQTMVNIVDESAPFARQRVIQQTEVVYAPDGAQPGTYGWVIDFDMPRATTTTSGNPTGDTLGQAPPLPQFPGERAVRRFIPNGDAVIVTTVIPRDANACRRGPPGSVFPVDPITGASPLRPVFDVNNDGRVDLADLTNLGGDALAAGILFDMDDFDGTLVDPSVLLGAGDNDFLYLSGGDDQVILRIAGPDEEKVGRRSWRELPNAQ
jgi:type IV pilus assembly protein PilY1